MDSLCLTQGRQVDLGFEPNESEARTTSPKREMALLVSPESPS